MKQSCVPTKRLPRGRKRKDIDDLLPSHSALAEARRLKLSMKDQRVTRLKVITSSQRKPPIPSGAVVLTRTSAPDIAVADENETSSKLRNNIKEDEIPHIISGPEPMPTLPSLFDTCKGAYTIGDDSCPFDVTPHAAGDELLEFTQWQENMGDLGVEWDCLSLRNANHNYIHNNLAHGASPAQRSDELHRYTMEQEAAENAEKAMHLDIQQFLVF
jgi:hypothetical protein